MRSVSAWASRPTGRRSRTPGAECTSPRWSGCEAASVNGCGLDDLHRESLCTLIESFGIRGLDEAGIDHFNHAWHRLDPWPDAVEGLTAMRRRYIIGTCSNGNVAMMVNMAKRAGLPWDATLGAEPCRAYKPLPQAYLGTCAYLDLPPERVVMVAAHNDDPRARRLPWDAHRLRRPPHRVRAAPEPGLRSRARFRLRRRRLHRIGGEAWAPPDEGIRAACHPCCSRGGGLRLLLAYPHARLLPAAHDACHRIRPLAKGRADPDPFHRLTDVIRRESFEHFRDIEPAGALPRDAARRTRPADPTIPCCRAVAKAPGRLSAHSVRPSPRRRS